MERNQQSNLRQLIQQCKTKIPIDIAVDSGMEKTFFVRGISYEDNNDKIYEIKHEFLGYTYKFLAIYSLINDCIIYLENANTENTIMGTAEFCPPDYVNDCRKIENDPKKYCVELLDKNKEEHIETWINFIQVCDMCNLPNLPTCRGLGGLFGLIYSFLSSNGFTGSIYLEDDSRYLAKCTENGHKGVDGTETFIQRLMLGKKTLYEEYSFYPVGPNNERTDYTQYVKIIANAKITVDTKNFGKIEGTTEEIVKKYLQTINPNNSEIYTNVLENLRQNFRTQYYGIKKILSRMKIDDIKTLGTKCIQTGGINYFDKYKKYKCKYLRLINSNQQQYQTRNHQDNTSHNL